MPKNRSPLAEMIKCRWREFCREPSAMFFVVLMPVLWMTILGFAFSGDGGETYGVGWPEDAAETPLANQVKKTLSEDERIRLQAGSPPEIKTMLRRGRIDLVLRTDADQVRYIYDPNNRTSRYARLLVNDLVQQAGGRTNPVKAVDEKTQIAGTRYIDFLVPGLLALSIMTSSLFGTGMTIVSNRRENLLKRYVATPMNPVHYIISHIVGRGFILVVELVAILLAGFLMFQFGVRGTLIELVLFSALGAAAFTSLAILCASRTSNMAAMNGMTNIIALPMMIVAGVWFSRSHFPDWIAEPARYLPLTPLVDGFRKIALEGATLLSLGTEVAILAAYLIVCTVTARVLFRWY